ncbi:PepSY domain-containing protein [Saccharomonospora sp. NPDC046836]|uniref:PepSY domain-containing protein n=1 Tax=Saccharomonospora sp. NPDC046836 TaxID=3156921 RepID=UPI003409D1FA
MVAVRRGERRRPAGGTVLADAVGVGEHAEHGAAGHEPSTGGQGDSAVDIGVDRVLATARTVGLDNPVEIVPPVADGEAYVVRQIQRSWPEKQDSAAIHPATGEVLDVLRFADYPLMAKLARWGIDAHMGLLFGWPNQVVLAAVCVAAIVLIVLGYRMWWQRRPTRDVFGVGRPFPRGGWRRLPSWALALLLVATAAVAWFLPLFGISLMAFLVLDAVLDARRRAVR